MIKYKPDSINRNFYYDQYHLVNSIDYSVKDNLWHENKICFYCNKSNREADKKLFGMKAHAVSKIFESKLYNYDECDKCNVLFSNKYESVFGLFFNSLKSLVISGKHKHKDANITFQNIDGNFYVTPTSIESINVEQKSITHRVTKPRIDYLDIYCALLKMSCLIFPRTHRDLIEEALKLLSFDSKMRDLARVAQLFGLWGINDEKSRERKIYLFRRRTNYPCPNYMCFIQYYRFYFQIYIPYSSKFPESICNIEPWRKIVPYQNSPEIQGVRNKIFYTDKIEEKEVIHFTTVSTDKTLFDDYLKSNGLTQ
ncbi:hypothetical protein [Leptospira interrogans]|uniref:hypothetical protein n=1 Tax=Leptospira interrogans TaxID=173 RepID=UPI000513B7A0|nr:hypothetical protein [Leptospira interrogans]KGE22242.1 hypothetical protein IQ65_21070 [Leptospira interrogans serovar Lai]